MDRYFVVEYAVRRNIPQMSQGQKKFHWVVRLCSVLVVVKRSSVLLWLLWLLWLLFRRDQGRPNGLEPPDVVLSRPHVHQQPVQVIAVASNVRIGAGKASSRRKALAWESRLASRSTEVTAASTLPMMVSTSSGSTGSGVLVPAVAVAAVPAVAAVGRAHADGTLKASVSA